MRLYPDHTTAFILDGGYLAWKYGLIHSASTDTRLFLPDGTLCVDSATNWRKAVLPHYKRNRVTANPEDRARVLHYLRNVLVPHYAGRVIEVSGQEADDTIAAHAYAAWANRGVYTTVIGKDKDYLQLPFVRLAPWHEGEHSQRTLDDVKVPKALRPLMTPFLYGLVLAIHGDTSDGVLPLHRPYDFSWVPRLHASPTPYMDAATMFDANALIANVRVTHLPSGPMQALTGEAVLLHCDYLLQEYYDKLH